MVKVGKPGKNLFTDSPLRFSPLALFLVIPVTISSPLCTPCVTVMYISDAWYHEAAKSLQTFDNNWQKILISRPVLHFTKVYGDHSNTTYSFCGV